MAPDGRRTVARLAGRGCSVSRQRGGGVADEAVAGSLKRESVNDWRRPQHSHAPMRRRRWK